MSKKITDLTALTTPDSTDVLPIVDISASTTKKTTVGGLLLDSSVTTAKIDDGAVTAAKLAIGNSVWAFLGYAEATSNQSSITSEVDITGLSVTVTVPSAATRIKITGVNKLINGTVDAYTTFRIKEGATALQELAINTRSGSTSESCTVMYVGTVTPGSHTYKMTAAASGSTTLTAAATRPNFILVECC